MKQELIIATKNKKKLKEIKDLLKGLNLKITSILDYPKTPRIVENGKSFKENAVKKAVVMSRFSGKLTLGEDSGLCVNALWGAPGIRSSRFSGKAKSDRKNNLRLLSLLDGVAYSKRKARYHCAIALADKGRVISLVEGTCRGIIGLEQKGSRGFGYDPLFIVPEYKKTFGELGEGIKHKISHRFHAMIKARKALLNRLKLKKK